ncbi:MAG: hypothetical protein BWX73_01712 [Lentisphaerae bacterium ADurb.Bin082]|nr:MAG: hypothetical protein BWX73_01712 [Lentisphaerae bacterium ADurb.Bin082]
MPLVVMATFPAPEGQRIAKAIVVGAGRCHSGGHHRDGDRLLRQQAVGSLGVIEGDGALRAVEHLRQRELDVVGADQTLIGENHAEHVRLPRQQERHLGRHVRLHHRHRNVRLVGNGQFDFIAILDLHLDHLPGIGDGLVVQEHLQGGFPTRLDLDVAHFFGVLLLADHDFAEADRQFFQGDLAVGLGEAAGQLLVGVGIAHHHQGAPKVRRMGFIVRIVVNGVHGQAAGAFRYRRRPERQRRAGKGVGRIDRQRAVQRGVEGRISVRRQGEQERGRLARLDAGQGVAADQLHPGQAGDGNRDRPGLVCPIVGNDHFDVAGCPAIALRVHLHGHIQRGRLQRQPGIARLGVEIGGDVKRGAFVRGDPDGEVPIVSVLGRRRALDREHDRAHSVARQLTQDQVGSVVVPGHLAVGRCADEFGAQVGQRHGTAIAQLQRAGIDVVHGDAPLDILGGGFLATDTLDEAQPEDVEFVLRIRASQPGIAGADDDMAGFAGERREVNRETPVGVTGHRQNPAHAVDDDVHVCVDLADRNVRVEPQGAAGQRHRLPHQGRGLGRISQLHGRPVRRLHSEFLRPGGVVEQADFTQGAARIDDDGEAPVGARRHLQRNVEAQAGALADLQAADVVRLQNPVLVVEDVIGAGMDSQGDVPGHGHPALVLQGHLQLIDVAAGQRLSRRGHRGDHVVREAEVADHDPAGAWCVLDSWLVRRHGVGVGIYGNELVAVLHAVIPGGDVHGHLEFASRYFDLSHRQAVQAELEFAVVFHAVHERPQLHSDGREAVASAVVAADGQGVRVQLLVVRGQGFLHGGGVDRHLQGRAVIVINRQVGEDFRARTRGAVAIAA